MPHPTPATPPAKPRSSSLVALAVGLLSCAGTALANPDPEAVVRAQVLPRYAALATASDALESAAMADCAPDSAGLRQAWSQAFDAWIGVSHLRFGPSETDDRAFALAFWPDTRGATPRALAALIAAQDPAVDSEAEFAQVSIAARGFYALEFLLYDPAFADPSPYHCALVQAIARDTSRIADAIQADWQGFAAEFDLDPATGHSSRYNSPQEALQELFKSVTTGLQFTSDTRIGRPMGSYDAPRPMRAEARRSGRSLRHVRLSLEATEALALALAADAPEVARDIRAAYAGAYDRVAEQDSPVFAGVTDPQGRFRVEMLQQAVDRVRSVVGTRLGPQLGVIEGFNALDGD